MIGTQTKGRGRLKDHKIGEEGEIKTRSISIYLYTAEMRIPVTLRLKIQREARHETNIERQTDRS
jgi:hypothetical protein